MDELFQRAAENYPLRVAKGDWEKVVQKLDGSSSHVVASRKFTRRGYLSTLIVLLLLMAGGLYTNFNSTNKKIAEAVPQKNNNPKQESSFHSRIPDKSESQAFSQIEPGRVPIQSQANSTADNHNLNHNKRAAEKKSSATFSLPLNTNQTIVERRKMNYSDGSTKNFLGGNNAPATANNYYKTEKKDNVGQPDSSFLESKDEEKSFGDIRKENVNAHQSIDKSKAGRFYFGIVFGPQLNQVKGQGFDKVGAELGLLFGYTLTKKISVESGLILSSKKYYSDGQYFDMKKISSAMPPSMKIIAVESNATALEVPLNSMYTLISKKGGSLFITAGVSSYLLLHEQNDYQALINGGHQELKGDYGNMRKSFATSISLSAGYEKSIGERVLIRVEPYLELPLKGLGVGSMSVFGTGLHLGLTLPAKKRQKN
jgi:hypothetical protein